jgi:adenosylmethionine-8-amino-7-oxononanoate aminotransferase
MARVVPTTFVDELARLDESGRLRHLLPFDGATDAEVVVGDRRLLMLASNNYLGLATHPEVRAAAAAATARYGAGSGASRLVAGDMALHHALERDLAHFKGTEAALLFTSGYHANIGILPVLVERGDVIFSDALNHASIVDGCRLSRARVQIYPHRDVAALERMLAAGPTTGRRLIVTDSVFSMDGDAAPLAALVELAGRHDAWLMVDEAHATGVLGPTGAGLVEALGLTADIPIHMGTLGKALGGFGAYAAGSRALIDLLINRARSFIYTTAPPPATVAAARAGLSIVAREPERRARLRARADQLRAGLRALGFRVAGDTHIVPLLVGDNAAAVALAEAAFARGIFVRAIRPPTVPAGTARLRLTPMATHSEEQIEHALAMLGEAGHACGLIARPAHVLPDARSPGAAAPPAGDDDVIAWDRRYLWHPFTQMADWLASEPLVITEADGNYLVDAAGRRYLDGVSSLWCNLHGHRRIEIDTAVRAQLDKVAHTTLLGLTSEPAVRLARALVECTPAALTRVFYSDAGATAVEVALRMALQYWQLRGGGERTELASLVGAYHGDTLGAIGVGYSESFHRFVRGATRPAAVRLTPPHVYRWERGYAPADALAAAITEAEAQIAAHARTLAALIVEPLMQGAAGMWAHPVEYLRALRRLTRAHGVLLICDEVATGFGRTGRLFACEHAQVEPDLLCLGKGISGGYLPLAATLATEEVFAAFLGRHEDYVAFFHGHTYTGNPLACAAGLASLEIFERDRVLERLPPLIEQLRARLAAIHDAHPHVGDVRQWGLMAGIELVADRTTRSPFPVRERIGARVTTEARRHGIILRPLGDVVVVMPPLSIRAAELDTLIGATRAAITAVTERPT